MNEDNERWLTDGNCMYCRKKGYCGKSCTAQKRRKQAIIQQMIAGATGSGKIRQALEGALNGKNI